MASEPNRNGRLHCRTAGGTGGAIPHADTKTAGMPA